MIVSYSDFGIYKRCPRQWAYKMMAQWNASDGRRELYLLKQLQSVSAWRGSLVDGIISDTLIPSWKKGEDVTLPQVLAIAERRIHLQLEFGRARRAWEPGMSKTKAGEKFAAFYDVELGEGLDADKLTQAKEEIELSLRNLFEMDDLIDKLRSASYLKAQQELRLERDDLMVRGIPDVLAVWRNGQPPLILDWKVSSFGVRDARLQVALYALCLVEGRHRADFAALLRRWKTTDVQLVEVQLLSKQQRIYKLTDEDVEDVESLLCSTIAQFKVASEQLAPKEWDPMQFPTTLYPETCVSCSFRTPCWKGEWKVEAKTVAKPRTRAASKTSETSKPRRKTK